MIPGWKLLFVNLVLEAPFCLLNVLIKNALKLYAFDSIFLLMGKENTLIKMFLELWASTNQKVEKIRAAATITTLASH